jgi:benzoyl-CoA reductase/2-hydroxyglutaryl-CoA dehydratase subunit BcrC/BadD/HgdB
MTFMMGTQEAYDFYKDLYEELKLKIDNKEGVISDEKYRLIWAGGLPSWFALGDFNYFNSKGAVFPVETTYRIVERIDRLDLPQTSDPLEHLAWRWVRNWTYWYDKARKRPGSEPDIERIIQYIEEYKIDGIVMHETFSCRTWHVGLIWQLNQIAKIYKPIPTMIIGKDGREEQVYKELPSLILESDIIDISSYNEADTRARIDTFIDILDVVKSKRE